LARNIIHMKQPESTEGPTALENFEKMAAVVFQAPKPDGRKTRKKSNKAASERKPKNHDEELDTHRLETITAHSPFGFTISASAASLSRLHRRAARG